MLRKLITLGFALALGSAAAQDNPTSTPAAAPSSEQAVQHEGDQHQEHAATDTPHDSHAHGEHTHDELPVFAEWLTPKNAPFPITNSMVMMWLVAAFLIIFAQVSTRKMSLIPSGIQNFAEWIVESLYNFLTTILGDENLTKRTFWFFGGVFILIITTNYAGLLPGVGTIGLDVHNSAHVAEGTVAVDHFRPFLRGGNADLNMTMSMSLIFAVMWFVWAIQANGLKGFLAHIFAPKAQFKGFMAVMMVAIFFLVGILEVVSIAIRPVALSFRLFGNIYGGEQTMEKLMTLVPESIAFAPVLPFMFMELLVGLVQALVFMLLSAVFLRLICDHGDHAEDHH